MVEYRNKCLKMESVVFMNRHAMRQVIVQTLYYVEVGNVSLYEASLGIEDFLIELKEEAMNMPDVSLSSELLDEAFELDDFYNRTLSGIHKNSEAIDEVIVRHLEGWSLNRLNKVDKAIIRLAVYEMMFDDSTASSIVINEAIELTKNFTDVGDKKSASFNNSLLDKIKV